MKYEYLKGSEKDFEGAPEWATLRTFTGGSYFFAEFHGAGARVLDIAQDDEFKTTILFDPRAVEIIAERRPITESSWDGVGMPPVGCECEMQDAVGEFIPVGIIANHDGFAFGWNYDRHAVYFSDKRCEFRPRRSEADKKRDGAVNEIASILEYRKGCSEIPLSGWIYDAIAADKIPGVKLED